MPTYTPNEGEGGGGGKSPTPPGGRGQKAWFRDVNVSGQGRSKAQFGDSSAREGRFCLEMQAREVRGEVLGLDNQVMARRTIGLNL